MNNAKIAERLDGMHVSDIKLEIGFLPETTLLSIDGCTRQFPFRGTELLAFCRAVVERCGLRIMNDKVHDADEFYKEDEPNTLMDEDQNINIITGERETPI